MEEEKKQEFWRWTESRWKNPHIDWEDAKFVTVGVDVGSVSSQSCIMADGQIFAYSNLRTGSDSPNSARDALNFALEATEMSEDRIDYCIGTGYGRLPVPFAEGRYTNRLKQIADTPRSGVVWWFDQTDMAQAKEILGDVSCIMGNVPSSIAIKGTVVQVKEYCRKLIEGCAPGGGYILSGGASVDKGKIENLQAMMEAAKEYGIY